MRRYRSFLLPSLAFIFLACGDAPPPETPKTVPPPAPRAATTTTNERQTPAPVFEKADADGEKKMAAGATMFIPKGWFVKTLAERIPSSVLK